MLFAALRVYYETVRARSIRKSSDLLGLVPSSVSRQIQALERELGTTLLERSTTGIIPTHGGTLVAEFAGRVLADYDSLKIDLNDQKGGQRALIRVAAVEGMVAAGPSQAMARFQQRFSGVTFSLTMCPAPAVVELVKARDVDIGITFSPRPDLGLRTLAQMDEPLVLACRRDDPIGAMEFVLLSDLADLRLALPSAQFGMRWLLDNAAAKAGFALHPVFVSDSFEALRDFASGGGAPAVLPLRALRQKDNSALHWTPLIDKRLPRTTIDVVALADRRASRIMKLFQDELARTLAEA
jgi:DNA-binding transcriptional LysR family regulator